jgi:hypothetical protein
MREERVTAMLKVYANGGGAKSGTSGKSGAKQNIVQRAASRIKNALSNRRNRGTMGRGKRG